MLFKRYSDYGVEIYFSFLINIVLNVVLVRLIMYFICVFLTFGVIEKSVFESFISLLVLLLN